MRRDIRLSSTKRGRKCNKKRYGFDIVYVTVNCVCTQCSVPTLYCCASYHTIPICFVICTRRARERVLQDAQHFAGCTDTCSKCLPRVPCFLVRTFMYPRGATLDGTLIEKMFRGPPCLPPARCNGQPLSAERWRTAQTRQQSVCETHRLRGKSPMRRKLVFSTQVTPTKDLRRKKTHLYLPATRSVILTNDLLGWITCPKKNPLRTREKGARTRKGGVGEGKDGCSETRQR